MLKIRGKQAFFVLSIFRRGWRSKCEIWNPVAAVANGIEVAAVIKGIKIQCLVALGATIYIPDPACASFNPHIADAQTLPPGTPYWTLKFTLGLPGSVLVALRPACTLLVRRCCAVPVPGSHSLSPVPCDTRMFQVADGLHCADNQVP